MKRAISQLFLLVFPVAALACSAVDRGDEVAGRASTGAPATTAGRVPDPAITAAPPTEPGETLPTTAPGSIPSAEPIVAEAVPFIPPPTDVLRDRKQAGGRFAEAVATYGARDTPESHAADLVERFGVRQSDDLVDLLTELMYPNAASVGFVHYAQMGGNRSDSASIMSWVDIEGLTDAGDPFTESRVMDVRLRIVDGTIEIERLASAGGPRVDRPADLRPLAADVADNPRISMADSARWDIFSGHTTDAMLQRMLDIAEEHEYGVLTLSRGHPYHVFATDSVSRHSVGQAVDVFEVDGQLVVDSRFEGSPTWTLTKNLFDAGIGSIGSPWAFDGYRGRSFTDDVHQDHLHITSL